MIFKDKKFLCFEDFDTKERSHEVKGIQLYTLGFPGVYDDCAVDAKIDPVNKILEINLDKESRENMGIDKKSENLLMADVYEAIHFQKTLLMDNYTIITE